MERGVHICKKIYNSPGKSHKFIKSYLSSSFCLYYNILYIEVVSDIVFILIQLLLFILKVQCVVFSGI